MNKQVNKPLKGDARKLAIARRESIREMYARHSDNLTGAQMPVIGTLPSEDKRRTAIVQTDKRVIAVRKHTTIKRDESGRDIEVMHVSLKPVADLFDTDGLLPSPPIAESVELLTGDDALRETVKVARSPKSVTAIKRKVHNLRCDLQSVDTDDIKAVRKVTRQIAHNERKIAKQVESKSTGIRQTDYRAIEHRCAFGRNELFGKLPEKPKVRKYYCFDCKHVVSARVAKAIHKLFISGNRDACRCRNCGKGDIRIL